MNAHRLILTLWIKMIWPNCLWINEHMWSGIRNQMCCETNFIRNNWIRLAVRLHEHSLSIQRHEMLSQIRMFMVGSNYRFDFKNARRRGVGLIIILRKCVDWWAHWSVYHPRRMQQKRSTPRDTWKTMGSQTDVRLVFIPPTDKNNKQADNWQFFDFFGLHK